MNEKQQKIQLQAKYCEDHKVPHFAPVDGICYNCHKQIYDAIPLQKATEELITGCPKCNHTFCD